MLRRNYSGRQAGVQPKWGIMVLMRRKRYSLSITLLKQNVTPSHKRFKEAPFFLFGKGMTGSAISAIRARSTLLSENDDMHAEKFNG